MYLILFCPRFAVRCLAWRLIPQPKRDTEAVPTMKRAARLHVSVDVDADACRWRGRTCWPTWWSRPWIFPRLCSWPTPPLELPSEA